MGNFRCTIKLLFYNETQSNPIIAVDSMMACFYKKPSKHVTDEFYYMCLQNNSKYMTSALYLESVCFLDLMYEFKLTQLNFCKLLFSKST